MTDAVRGLRDDATRGRGRPRSWRIVGVRYLGGDVVVYQVPTGVTGAAAIERRGRPLFVRSGGVWLDFATLRPVHGLRFARLRVLRQLRLSPPRPEPQQATPGGQLVLFDVYEGR